MRSRIKHFLLIGTLEYPLSVGSVTFIEAGRKGRRTSAVKGFLRMPGGLVYIRTRNSRYLLLPPRKEVRT